jgi:hypothetical protein
MDGQRFDELARVLGLALNRKRFLGLLAGVVVPVAAGGSGEAGARSKNNRGKRRKQNRQRDVAGVDAQGAVLICFGTCAKDTDCPEVADCVCDESLGRCVTVTCGGRCTKDTDCPPLAGCECSIPTAAAEVGAEQQGLCVTATCGGFCSKDSDCPESPGCICDESTRQCVTIACAGSCFKDSDCGLLPNCVCNLPPVLQAGAEGPLVGTCGPPNVCPGLCDNNAQCTQQGADSCVCFLGAGVNVADVSSEGANGLCGECHTLNHVCNASTECCGQLVCLNGTCQRKPTPPASGRRARRCNKHGRSCHVDRDCCAQGVCYHGKCGEKDTHCDTDSECARGYRCVGGDLTGSHKRCRKNGRRRKNKRGKHRK